MTTTLIEKPNGTEIEHPLENMALAQVELEERMFALAQRKAKVYSQSDLVPEAYKNNIGNVIIAQNMADRMGADALMVMQNLYIVHGRPAWSSQFLIATFNSCGRFSAVRYRFSGEVGKDSWGCVAYATEKNSGEVLEGTCITIKLAKDEGWHGKKLSKWQTMPEQMLRYRAASFFIRTVAPEIGMGLLTREEVDDMGPEKCAARPRTLAALTERIIGNDPPAVEETIPAGSLRPATFADCATAEEVNVLRLALRAEATDEDVPGIDFDAAQRVKELES